MIRRAGQVLKCDYCRRTIRPKELYVKHEDGTNECGKCYLTMRGLPFEDRSHQLDSRGKVSLSSGFGCDIRVLSDRFARCDFCSGAIRPKEEYFWDPDNGFVMCSRCYETLMWLSTPDPEDLDEPLEDIPFR